MARSPIHRLIPAAAAVLALAALGGCGKDDEPDGPVATVPGLGSTTPGATATSPDPSGSTQTTTTGTKKTTTTQGAKTTTTPGTKTSPGKTSSTTKPPPPPRVQAKPPEQLTPKQAESTSSAAAEALAKTEDAERCPDALQDGAGAKDIVAAGTSCGRAKLVIFSGGTGPDAGGFVCDVVGESFDPTPTILYSCSRADGAKIRYTAVG